MAEYTNYQDALEHETINKLKAEVKELEARTKLEKSLNTLAFFILLGIIVSIAVVVLFILGVTSYSFN